MATFVTTIKFTEQGIRNVEETCTRATQFTTAAKQMGVTVRDIYWTLGPSDGVIIIDAPDEETATAAMLHLGSHGNVQTQTVRAYKTAEMEQILGKMPK